MRGGRGNVGGDKGNKGGRECEGRQERLLNGSRGKC